MQLNLLESFAEFKEFKNVDKETLMAILEEVFRNMIIKKYGSDENFDIIINPEKGDLEIWRNREIVKDGEVEDENIEVALSEALKVEDDFEVGEELSEEIKLESFGRRNVLSLRQNLAGRILDMEKDALYTKYKERVDDFFARPPASTVPGDPARPRNEACTELCGVFAQLPRLRKKV